MGIRVENKRDTNDKTWQYDAFISYRHSELDSFVAETLHRQLENFKLPGSVVKQKKADMIGIIIFMVFMDCIMAFC